MPAVTVTRGQPELWSVTFGNPPANLVDPETILELQAHVDQLEHDPAVTVRDANPRRDTLSLDPPNGCVGSLGGRPANCVGG
jgi:hypothetical protein